MEHTLTPGYASAHLEIGRRMQHAMAMCKFTRKFFLSCNLHWLPVGFHEGEVWWSWFCPINLCLACSLSTQQSTYLHCFQKRWGRGWGEAGCAGASAKTSFKFRKTKFSGQLLQPIQGDWFFQGTGEKCYFLESGASNEDLSLFPEFGFPAVGLSSVNTHLKTVTGLCAQKFPDSTSTINLSLADLTFLGECSKVSSGMVLWMQKVKGRGAGGLAHFTSAGLTEGRPERSIRKKPSDSA